MSLQSHEIPRPQQEVPKVEIAEAKPEQRAERAKDGEDNIIQAAERFVKKEMRGVVGAERRFQGLSGNVETLQKSADHAPELYPNYPVFAEKISQLLRANEAEAKIAGNAFEVKKSNRELQDVKKFIELAPQFKGMDKAALEAKQTELLAELKNLQGHERDVVAEGEYNQVNKSLDVLESYTRGLATMERKITPEMRDTPPVTEAPRMAA